MKRTPRIVATSLGVLGALSASCATESVRPDYEGARALITARTGAVEVHDPEGEPPTEAQIAALLADGLGLDEALRLALLNNRRLHAGFAALGIGRADEVQAGLLANPVLDLGLLFPAGGGQTRVAAGVAQGVMELWHLPERRRAAAAGMEHQLLELARQAGDLVADTRAAYATCVAARELHAAAEQDAELARRASEAMRTRAAQGVATEPDVQRAEGEALLSELHARDTAHAQAVAARELASLLSLETDLAKVPLTDALPETSAPDGERESWVRHGLAQRLELRALDAEIAAAQARLQFEQEHVLADPTVGVAFERPESDSPTDHVLGPTASVELPVFDRNEAGIARAASELAVLERTREAVHAELGQRIRAAIDRARLAADAARLARESLLPQALHAARLAQRAFDLGDTTLLPLLDAERAAAQARAASTAAALQAVLATSELERALGGPARLSGPAASAP